jgi:hypothetical protein
MAVRTAKVQGMPKQPLDNWVQLNEKGELRSADSPQQPLRRTSTPLGAGRARQT